MELTLNPTLKLTVEHEGRTVQGVKLTMFAVDYRKPIPHKNLKYIIEAFEKDSQRLSFEIVLPDGCDAQLSKIMVWSAPQLGDE